MYLKYFFAFIIAIMFISCNSRKITEFNIKNENNYPVSITVKTNNVEHSFKSIKPKSEINEVYDWTNLEKKDGQWVFFVKNDQTGGQDSFSHGYYTNGELYNYAELISEGSQLKVRISE